MEIKKAHTCFGGKTIFATHQSESTKTVMSFSMHLPCGKKEVENVIIWLSGLTCNEENFITKAGAQRYLENTKTVIICPDTSPRGLSIEGADDSYDFGTAASFYVNSTTEKYREHFQMDDYITIDLVKLINDELGTSKISIMGHSMGGHGALVLGLRNPNIFTSISAFSPIVNPVQCPWGQKALSGYLGDDKSVWNKYDATELIKSGARSSQSLYIDQGLEDEFLEKELLTENLKNACKECDQEILVKYREGHDHSYYFISTYIEDHIKFHMRALKN